MLLFASLCCGLLFGLGLIVCGLADPAKVLAFLDVAGAWDPSLLLVMAGAIGVSLPAFVLVKRRGRGMRGAPLHLPTATRIDRKLVFGSTMFGIGWGIAGICPGPALVGLGFGLPQAGLFVPAMLAGMALHALLEKACARPTS
ncbi:MAG: YeeE/YedE family protein [Pseudomonadota bacterium]